MLSTRCFTAPVALPAAECCPPELRLLLDGLRAPLDEARFDCDRLLRAAGRERELDEPDRVPERDFALAPFALEPLRLDAERPPVPLLRLDELRPPAEPPFCPDFELPWAIMASLLLSLGLGRWVDLRERFADALDVVPKAVNVLAHPLTVLPDALADLADLLDDAMNIYSTRAPARAQRRATKDGRRCGGTHQRWAVCRAHRADNPAHR